MTEPSSDRDAVLLGELRAALAESSQVPPDFIVAARAAFAWRTIDADLLLAELAFDSAHDEQLATRAGSAGATRLLVFDGAGRRIEAQVSDGAIVGQVTPPDGGRVSCQTTTETFDEAAIDEQGCFVLRSPTSGAVRLRIQSDRGGIATSWICLP
jgi:hypothetical protein